MESAKKLLRKYGKEVRPGRQWARVVNTDFSAKIKLNPTHNTKNDIVWSTSREEAGDLLECKEEKFSLGVMIWGGISFQGLVPPQAPLFVDEMCKKYDSTSKTVKANTYAQMIKNEVRNGVDRVFPNGDAIFQDDGASNHRLQVSLEAVSSTFSSRVSPKDQASKMADVWPIENIWSIVMKILLKIPF